MSTLNNAGFGNAKDGTDKLIGKGLAYYDAADSAEQARLDSLVFRHEDLPAKVAPTEVNAAVRAYLMARQQKERPAKPAPVLPVDKPASAMVSGTQNHETIASRGGRPPKGARKTPRITLPKELAAWVDHQWRSVVPPDGTEWETRSDWIVAALSQLRAQVEAGTLVVHRPQRKFNN